MTLPTAAAATDRERPIGQKLGTQRLVVVPIYNATVCSIGPEVTGEKDESQTYEIQQLCTRINTLNPRKHICVF
jgi:hypothetical protein